MSLFISMKISGTNGMVIHPHMPYKVLPSHLGAGLTVERGLLISSNSSSASKKYQSNGGKEPYYDCQVLSDILEGGM